LAGPVNPGILRCEHGLQIHGLPQRPTLNVVRLELMLNVIPRLPIHEKYASEPTVPPVIRNRHEIEIVKIRKRTSAKLVYRHSTFRHLRQSCQLGTSDCGEQVAQAAVEACS
jgi:hypothetical protein